MGNTMDTDRATTGIQAGGDIYVHGINVIVGNNVAPTGRREFLAVRQPERELHSFHGQILAPIGAKQPEALLEKGFCNVIPPLVTFQGRNELLILIQTTLQRHSASQSWKNRAVALVGFGGMGKTEMARKFASDFKDEYLNVAWINAECKASIDTSFLELAMLLGVDVAKNQGGIKCAEEVFKYVSENSPKALFIYDNAAGSQQGERTDFDVFDYFPKSDSLRSRLFALITSQTSEWNTRGIEVIPVNELSEQESMEYFRSRFGLPSEELEQDQGLKGIMRDLAVTLQGYPLGLQVATSTSIVTYTPGKHPLSFLRKELERVLSMIQSNLDRSVLDQPVGRTDSDYPRTLRSVWVMAMERLSSYEAASAAEHLLRILAYCNPDRAQYDDVRKSYESSMLQDANLNKPIKSAIDSLLELSLVQLCKDDWGGTYFRIHRMVQKLARRDELCEIGLDGSLLAEIFKVKSYFDAQNELAIPPSIIQNDKLSLAWLLGVLHLLLLSPESTNGSGRKFFQLCKDQEKQLRGRDSFTVQLMVYSAELITQVISARPVDDVNRIVGTLIDLSEVFHIRLDYCKDFTPLILKSLCNYLQTFWGSLSSITMDRLRMWLSKTETQKVVNISLNSRLIFRRLLRCLKMEPAEFSFQTAAHIICEFFFHSQDLGSEENDVLLFADLGRWSIPDLVTSSRLLDLLPQLLIKYPFLNLSLGCATAIRRTILGKPAGAGTSLSVQGLEDSFKNWVLYRFINDVKYVQSGRMDDCGTAAIYMGYVACFCVALEEYHQTNLPLSQGLIKWVPASMFLSLLPEHLRLALKAGEHTLKHQRTELECHGWDLQVDNKILNEVLDAVKGSQGMGEYICSIHCAAIKALLCYNKGMLALMGQPGQSSKINATSMSGVSA